MLNKSDARRRREMEKAEAEERLTAEEIFAGARRSFGATRMLGRQQEARLRAEEESRRRGEEQASCRRKGNRLRAEEESRRRAEESQAAVRNRKPDCAPKKNPFARPRRGKADAEQETRLRAEEESLRQAEEEARFEMEWRSGTIAEEFVCEPSSKMSKRHGLISRWIIRKVK